MSSTTITTPTPAPEWFQQFYQPTTSTLGGRPSDTTPNTNYFTGLGIGPDHSFLGSAVNSPTSPTTVISTTTATTTTPTGSSLLNPVQDGRVSKPARRRTRASRKNPTTLLNTDTTNFRAMVQRYTGGTATYSPPFDSTSGFMNIAGGGLHVGQNCNFNQQPGSSGLLGLQNYPSSASAGGVDLRAQQLHQQLLQQYSAAAFSSTGNVNAGSAGTRAVEHRAIGLGVDQEEGVSSLSHAGSRVGPGSGHYASVGGDGGGEIKRGGDFTY